MRGIIELYAEDGKVYVGTKDERVRIDHATVVDVQYVQDWVDVSTLDGAGRDFIQQGRSTKVSINLILPQDPPVKVHQPAEDADHEVIPPRRIDMQRRAERRRRLARWRS
jgi:hypothetical protein